MNRMPALRILTPALLGTVLALGAALPASAARQDRDDNDQRVERKQRPAQREQPRTAMPNRPIPAQRSRSSDDQRRENWGELARQAQERQRAESPRPAFEAPPQRAAEQDGREQQREQFQAQRMAQQKRIADQREQLDAQRAAEQRDREQQRQQSEAQRASQQRMADQREQQRRDDDARSPQARVIAGARQREERRDDRQDRPGQRPDWRNDRNEHRDRDDDRGRPDWRGTGDHGRVDRDQQQHRIEEQRRRQAEWQREEARRRAQFDRNRHDLERQHRTAQYRYQQDYWRRWQAEQARRRMLRIDYGNDPFFYTPYNYRYSYGGRWYNTNSYGARMLEQAVRDGYQEGWYAGQADRMDRWRFDYDGNIGYLDGSYGYYGQYVSLGDYRYYFRQGFERGYRDGYYGRSQYGLYRSGGATILPAILGMILAFSIDN